MLAIDYPQIYPKWPQNLTNLKTWILSVNQESYRGVVGCLWPSLPGVYNQGVFWSCSYLWTQLEGNPLWSAPRGAVHWSQVFARWSLEISAPCHVTFSVGLLISCQLVPPRVQILRERSHNGSHSFFKTWSLNWHPITSAVFNSLEVSNQTQPNLKRRIT